ncbi:MAG: hypothetical protein ACPIOQ_11670, partial [Promethearchaeia archaeon]
GVCLPALWVSWVMVQAESAWGPDGDMEEEPARSGRLKSQMSSPQASTRNAARQCQHTHTHTVWVVSSIYFLRLFSASRIKAAFSRLVACEVARRELEHAQEGVCP